jgi:sigma-B regulation protein RsbU (phosphoserine phosphatase)
VLVLRFVRRRMLWSLRSKLVLTYLLIGLAPVVLFVTLVTISAYIAAGQFAIHLADTRLQAELNQMASDNGHLTAMMRRFVEANPGQAPPRGSEPGAASDARPVHRETRTFINGAPLMQEDRGVKTPFGLPPWAADLKGESFQGLVLDNGELFLVAIHQERLKDGRLFSAMTSLPVDAAVMDGIADGLGRVGLLRRRTGTSPGVEAQNDLTAQRSQAPVANQLDRAEPGAGAGVTARSWVYGGSEPPSAGLSDIRVRFVSTTSITDWDTGEADNALIEVDSRPSLLYRQLFGASLGGVVTSGIRIGLISLCVAFALLELLALVLAIRLSRTITASVADLYEATQKIDRGELDHLIRVNRDDQLAELSKSFNRMTGSLQRLLLEQQEKERLQNELSIAQEVQANLFPRQDCDLSTLQLHGVCRPARSVSGDYYDFLVFHEEAVNGARTARRDTGVGIALGDISGKGISAALLMATLHSAVRAYRFASEELVYSESQVDGLTASRDGNGGLSGELFESPGRILSLLNRHLYRSTQPEKYATLFLAHYDADSSMMTYSNGGQLPPLVLGQDGSVRRLDKGGTVVGLMDGMSYEEDSFKMQPGDIMVAYSDGVTEPENDFGEFGEEQMMEVIRLYRDQPLHVISSQVMQALDAWIGAEEQPDDITLVLARQL